MWHIPFFTHHAGHHHHAAGEKAGDITIALAGRALFASVFLVGGVTHFARGDQMIEYTLANGVSGAGFLVPMTGLMLLAGGISVLLGYYARIGAWILTVFLIPTTILMHRFWGLDNPALESVQFAHFMKNLGLTGAALLMTHTGGGPGSLDRS